MWLHIPDGPSLLVGRDLQVEDGLVCFRVGFVYVLLVVLCYTHLQNNKPVTMVIVIHNEYIFTFLKKI